MNEFPPFREYPYRPAPSLQFNTVIQELKNLERQGLIQPAKTIVGDNQKQEQHHRHPNNLAHPSAQLSGNNQSAAANKVNHVLDVPHGRAHDVVHFDNAIMSGPEPVRSIPSGTIHNTVFQQNIFLNPHFSYGPPPLRTAEPGGMAPFPVCHFQGDPAAIMFPSPSTSETFFDVNPQFYCDQLRRESYSQFGHHIYQNWPNATQGDGPLQRRRKPRAIEPSEMAVLEESKEQRRRNAEPQPHQASKTRFRRAAKFKNGGEHARIPRVREENNEAFVDATANIAGMLDDVQNASNDNNRRTRRSKSDLPSTVVDKEAASTTRFSKNTLLRWISFGKLGKIEKRTSDIEAMSLKSDKSSKWFKKTKKRVSKQGEEEQDPKQVSTWPLESATNCTVVNERVDDINVGNLRLTQPNNCSPAAQQCPMGIGYKVYSSKRKEGRKLMGFPVYPEVRVTLEDHARMERRDRKEKEERLTTQGLISERDWRNPVQAAAEPDAKDSLRPETVSADNNHSYYNNYPPPSSTEETEEKPLTNEGYSVHGGNTWIDSVFSGSVGRLDAVDSQNQQQEQEQQQPTTGTTEGQITESYKVKQGVEKRNASTSPIQHLSSLCTLNIPVVSPSRFMVSSDGPDVTDSAVVSTRPVPKPRGVFSRADQKLLLHPFDEAEEDRVQTLMKVETDELSANVEKILDDIADMELECWKNDMMVECIQRNALNPIHANTLPPPVPQVGKSFEEEGRDLLKVEGGDVRRRARENASNEISRCQQPEQQQVAEDDTANAAVVGKPPLPPNVKSIAGIRRDFLSRGCCESGEIPGAMNSGSGSGMGSTKRLQKPGGHVEEKLLKFRAELHRSREELAKSHPNLDEMERTVRSSVVGTDRSKGGSLRVGGGSSKGSGAASTTAPVSTSISPALLPDTGTTRANCQQKHSEKSRGERTTSSNYVETRGNGIYSRRSASSGSSTGSSSSRPKHLPSSSTPPPTTTPADPVTLENHRISQEWATLVRRASDSGGDKKGLRDASALVNSTNNHTNSQHGKSYPRDKSITTNQDYKSHHRRVIETDLDQDTFWTGTELDAVYKPKYERVYRLPGYGGSYYNNRSRSPLGDLNNKKKSYINDENALCSLSLNIKTKSLGNLGQDSFQQEFPSASEKREKLKLMTSSNYNMAESLLSVGANNGDDRARSMEFLLDDSDKNAHLLPPENKLMLDNRQMSEHELRIQRSLTKLNVPDWYKSYGRSGTASGGATPTSAPPTTTGATLGSRNKLYGSGTGLAGGWSGLSTSKTNSLTSLQSAGRYSGRSSSALGSSSRNRATTGTPSGGGRSSRESLMSPSSTASVSPSPYYERSSFTYGMPYALTRFAGARMSCGASPASLSPSPSPVGGVAGSSTSTPVASAPLSRHHSYSKAPYLGWRSQERLASKNLYRTPAERLAADLLVQKQKAGSGSSPSGGGSSGGGGSGSTTPSTTVDTLEKKMELTETEGSSKAGTVSASSDLSLNNSEESSSKLHRVRSSIKEVSNAIVDYVNETKDVNGSVSPRRGYIWLETAFVGTKPIDSPGTPDTPSIMMNNNRNELMMSTTTTATANSKPEVFRFDEQVSSSRPAISTAGGASQFALAAHRMRSEEDSYASAANNGVAAYGARNEQTEERSNSSSVSSPTMEDILDSLLALRRPNKKSRSKSKGVKDSGKGAPPPPPPRQEEAPKKTSPAAASDWHERMNQPLDDTAYFPTTDEYFSTTTTTTAAAALTTVVYSDTDEPPGGGTVEESVSSVGDKDEDDNSYGFNSKSERLEHIEKESRRKQQYFSQESPSTANPPARMQSMLSYELGVSSRDYPGAESKSKDEVEVVLETVGDEDAFGSPAEMLPTSTCSSSAAVNPLTNDSSNNSTPAKRRVSFDLDVSDKEEKSSSRSRRESESVAGTIVCRNSKCGKSATGLEARREFKTCHNCNAYYCGRECRRAHWEKHKKVCMQSRVGALCKQIINHVKEDGFAVQQLSGVARRGVLAKGRGCVKLFFSSPDRAERFLTGGYPELPEPWYIPCGDILPEEMGAQTFSELNDQCKTYNTESRFIIYVSVCVVNEVPTSGAVKWEREMISRSAKLRLHMPKSYEESQMHHQAASALSLFPDESSAVVVPPPVPPRDSSTVLTSIAAAPSGVATSGKKPENINRPTVSPPPPPVVSSGSKEIIIESPNGDDDTLILKSVPPPTFHTLSGSETRRLREVSFANIQRHLNERGVNLRQIYPEIYTKLCNYVEHDETFLPVTIYPRNMNTGRNFMCVIMPDFTTSADTTIQHMPNPLHEIPTGSVETINVAEESCSDYDLR